MHHHLIRIALLLSLGGGIAVAQNSAAPAVRNATPTSTVYASVVATHLFVVGGANPRTGLFLQHPGEDTTWRHVGPNNIRAFSLAVPTQERGRVLYIASGNGVQKSTDGGATWKITTDWRITEVLWVAPDPRDTNTVYCATEFGIFKTTDGCATWKEMNRGLTSRFTQCVIVDRALPGKVYSATEDGLFQSTDGAATWTRMGLSVGGTRVIAQHPSDPGTLLAGTESYGIYVSRDGGNVWVRSEAGVDHATFYTIAFDPTGPDTVYAGGYVTGVYKSTDGAKSWRRVNDGLGHLNIHAIAVDPTDGRRVYAATMWGGVYRTDNGGASWRPAGLGGAEVWNLAIQPF
jgi:photosystem II stability/assembly factor-like uncharacterized protein